MQKRSNVQHVRITTRLALLVILLVLGTSCNTDEDLKQLHLTVDLQFPNELDTIGKVGFEVILKNNAKGISIKNYTNASGEAIFDDVEPGQYSVTASITMRLNNRPAALNGYVTVDLAKDYA